MVSGTRIHRPHIYIEDRFADRYVDQELLSLIGSVKQVGKVIEKVYGADGLTIACQVRIIGTSIIHIMRLSYQNLLNT